MMETMEVVQARPLLGRLARLGLPRPTQAFFVVLAAGIASGMWQLVGRKPLWWGDSDDYLATSRSSFFSLDLWAGDRPVAVPLLLKLVRGDDKLFVYGQVVIAALCWAALAAAVVGALPAGRRAWLAVGAIAATPLAHHVAMWDLSVLSESLAMSGLVLVLAAGIHLVRGASSWRAVLFLAAVATWLLTRDSHAAVALIVGGGFTAWYVVGRPQFDQRRAVLAVGLVGLAVLTSASAAHGHRYSYPLRNVFAARILPYPDRVDWFADHGMPQAEEFAEPVAAEPGQPPVRWIAEHDPAMQPWVDWVDRAGRSTFLRWMLTHPDYVLTEPWRVPERAFNDADGDRSFYAPPDMRHVPLVTGLLFPPRMIALLIAVAATVWAIDRRRWRSPLFVTGAVTVLLAGPHALLSWHSDAMEVARHLVVPVFQLHLGVLLMVIGALAGGQDPEPDAPEPHGPADVARTTRTPQPTSSTAP